MLPILLISHFSGFPIKLVQLHLVDSFVALFVANSELRLNSLQERDGVINRHFKLVLLGNCQL